MRPDIHTEIGINAPASVVWDVLTDLAAYAAWNPFIRESSGRVAVGETLVCCPQLPGSRRRQRYTPTVIRVEPEREFAWFGEVLHRRIGGGEHIFRIIPRLDGGVTLAHQQIFVGVSAPLVMRLAGGATKRGFEMMNEALKARAEQRVRA